MLLPKGAEILEWIMKWSRLVEPHVFTFAQKEIQSQLVRTCPAEWIDFIDDQILKGNEDVLLEKLLKLIKFSDPSIDSSQVPDQDYWPQSIILCLGGEI